MNTGIEVRKAWKDNHNWTTKRNYTNKTTWSECFAISLPYRL